MTDLDRDGKIGYTRKTAFLSAWWRLFLMKILLYVKIEIQSQSLNKGY